MLLRDTIARLLEDPLDVVLARAILGTSDVEVIAARVEAHVARELGRSVVACPLFSQSVGAVWKLALDDGSEVVLKAHSFGGDRFRGFASLAELRAAYAAQVEIAAAGVPCARVLSKPSAFGEGAAAIMSAIPDAPADAAHDPATRTAMARMLARIVELGRTVRIDGLVRDVLPPSTFHPPHNALFDFDAPGAEWIDARARAARAVLDRPAPLVVMHSDFSCANVRVTSGEVTAVFDMDSVCFIDELRNLASIAVHFTYSGDGEPSWPSRDEARAFVADYEAARGRIFNREERTRLDAGAIYALAYTARCQHGRAGSSREVCDALAAAPDAYFQ